ncbi:type II toxin-antitoxin system VapC family toxin [soil metagenome]
MYLLDTNVISELRKGKSNKANENVIAWAASTKPGELFVSSITIFEIELGILLVERKDKHQGARLRCWLEDSVLQGFANRILAVDTAVARKCAELSSKQPKSERDAFIAATALVHRMKVVTRNVKDFKIAGLEIIDPWSY